MIGYPRSARTRLCNLSSGNRTCGPKSHRLKPDSADSWMSLRATTTLANPLESEGTVREGAHHVPTVRPFGGFGRLEDALVDAVHGECLARAVARGAAFAQGCCVGQGVGSSGYVVVATLARRGDRRRGLGEAARTGDQCLGADVFHQISAGHVAGGAIPQVAREPDVLVIGGPQRVRVDQVLAAVNAVDLPGEVHALIGGAIHQGGIVTLDALHDVGASTAVDESQIHMACVAFSSGHYLAAWRYRALVHGEIELHRRGGIDGGSRNHGARK